MGAIAVCGTSVFTLGFALSGIQHLRNAEQDAPAAFKELMANPDISVILTDQDTLQRLPEHQRQTVEQSVKPVVVVLSADGAQDSLRKMIKKSIGVDLWV